MQLIRQLMNHEIDDYHPDEILIRPSDAWGHITAIFLVTRGQAPMWPDGEWPKHGEYPFQWVQRQVSPELWDRTFAEVKSMPVEPRNLVLDTFELEEQGGRWQ